MKLKFLLCLLIFLQLSACQKRYGYLKKIRVHNENKKEFAAVQKKLKSNDRVPFNAEFSVDSNIILNPRKVTISSKPVIMPHQKHRDHKPKITARHSVQKDTYSSPESSPEIPTSRWNKNAVLAFVISIFALASFFLIFAAPLIGFLLVVILASFAFNYAGRALKEIDTTNEKGNWMALAGAIMSGLVLSGIIALTLLFLGTFSARSASNRSIWTAFFILTSGIFALMMYAFFPVKKEAPASTADPAKPLPNPSDPGTNTWNHAAVITLILSVIAAIFILITIHATAPFLGAIAFLAILVALIMGIYALFEIRSTHEKGKLFAWIGILLVPILFVLFIPPLAILVILCALVWWRIKAHHDKKAYKVSLS